MTRTLEPAAQQPAREKSCQRLVRHPVESCDLAWIREIRPHYPCPSHATARRSHGSSIMAPFRSMLSLPVPPPGQRTRVGGLIGSSDALALAGLAASRKPLAVFTASAGDGQRLVQEIALLRARAARAPAAGLGDAALRQLLAAPGPDVRAARDPVSDLAPGLRRHRGAGDHGAVPAAAGGVPRRLQLLPQAGRDDCAGGLAQAARSSPATSTSPRWCRRASSASAAG